MLNREPEKKRLVFYNRRGYIELWTRMALFFKKKKFIHREFKRTGEIITCSSNMRCYSDAFEWHCFNSFWIEHEKPSGIQEINESSCLVEMGTRTG